MSKANQSSQPGLSRRRILQYGATGAGLALLPWQLRLAQAGAHADAQPMRQRRIFSTGEMLPVMGLGSSDSFATHSADTLADLRRVMTRFVAMGGTVVDTSPTYGNAEVNIGHIAQATGVRDRLFMATKVHARGRHAGIEQMARSTQALGKPIDLMQVHNLVDLDTQWATLEKMKADGQLRYIGITHYLTSAFDELEHLLSTRDMDFVQFNYSIMTPEAEDRLLPLAADRRIAVLVNRPFNDGRFFAKVKGKLLPEYAADFDCGSWAQFALKYVLANGAVTAVIPATSDPAHLEDNMKAGYGRLPDRGEWQRMRETMASL